MASLKRLREANPLFFRNGKYDLSYKITGQVLAVKIHNPFDELQYWSFWSISKNDVLHPIGSYEDFVSLGCMEYELNKLTGEVKEVNHDHS